MTATCKYISGMRIFISLFVLVVYTACNEKQQAAAGTAKKTETTIDTVKVFVVSKDSVQKTIVLPGDLLPNENVQIRAKVQGYIKTVKADIGSKVHKGQVLATIEAPEINSRVRELNSKVRAAQARFQSSKDYYDRISTASKSEGVIAASELQKTKNQMLADKAEYESNAYAASSYKQVGNYLAIVAPYSGTITKRNIEAGSFVGNPNEKPLFELEDNATLRLRVSVPEIYTGTVLLDNSGDLTTRSFPDKKFKAKLVRKSGSIDNASRSEIWEFEVPNASRELKAGSYADVKLHFVRPQSSLVVPASSVVTTMERKFVIKVTNNTTNWIDVRTGINMGEKQEIFADLNIGDTLVLKSNEELKAGTKIISKKAQ
jgi:membrane fusion protein (multidrug efflux system)